MPHDQVLPTRPAAPLPTHARPRASWRALLRRVWFRIHWFIGITAGTVLVVIGLTGATLAFRDEITDALSPGVRQVAVRDAAVLSPGEVMKAVAASHPGARVVALVLSSVPGAAVRVSFAPPPGKRRGESIHVDPYTGALQPTLRGDDFFEWVEQLHRWLLLPRDTGKTVTGVLAGCLLTMALSGLWLRWPRRVASWRSWLTFDTRMTGRLWLRGLHSTIGTVALVVYLVSTSTGLYWGFDAIKDAVDGWVGARVERPTAPKDRPGARRADVARPRDAVAVAAGTAGAANTARPAAAGSASDGGRAPAGAPAAIDLDTAWSAFVKTAGPWRSATLRLPERASQPVQLIWLTPDVAHERARNRMLVDASGAVTQDDRFVDQSRGARLVALVLPLHTGTALGLPGRIAMMGGGLMLPVFAVTGWWMYLQRRRRARRSGSAA